MDRKCFLILTVFVSSFLFTNTALAENGGWELPENLRVKPHLYGYFEAGQILQGHIIKSADELTSIGISGSQIDHIWNQDAVSELGFDAFYGDHLKMGFTLGSKLYFSYPLYNDASYTKNMRQDVYIGDLFAQYFWGDVNSPTIMGEVGYFKFKYNPDARNFGDYLFRTGTYPIWFDMSFDNPWKSVLGFHSQSNLFNSLKIDALLISPTIVPLDWSLAGLVSYDVLGLDFLEIGAGVDFAHLLSVYTDHYNKNLGGNPTTPDAGSSNNRYLVKVGDSLYDTLWYTFKGTKVMGRLSVNPKVYLPFKEIFGESDLRLYVEADIVGTKSYPDTGLNFSGSKKFIAPSYNKLFEKMPVAFGFNAPTFKLIDIINCEFEWFSAKYYNDASNQVVMPVHKPLPYNVDYFFDTTMPRKSFWKWNVYVKKSFSNGHFAITGQIGRDHSRLPCFLYSKELWNELLVTKKDWAWYLKTSWMF